MFNLYIMLIEAMGCPFIALGAGWVVAHGETGLGAIMAICGAAIAIDATWRFIKLVWGVGQ